ncbi:hypothetical protein BH23CYA1_BH23CYA1_05980 [soil metagenome]|uniref:hypothetical protein n=1 Tax=Leptolyngbya sp. BC1307 TaxID=2029589 RepID=UPI000EFCE21B|nr:hypothetical protein [Leptolyngbya sp. BC1307]
MTNYSSTPADGSSPALLALRRFIRGTLRQVGLGLLSLGLILSLSAPVTADSVGSSGQRPVDQASTHISTDSAASLAQPSKSTEVALKVSALTQLSSEFKGAAATQSLHLLKPRMTHHRLTSAHLFIPQAAEQIVVSLTKDD